MTKRRNFSDKFKGEEDQDLIQWIKYPTICGFGGLAR